jgi:hypothetical protein
VANYVVQGALGAGKSITSVARIKDYLHTGRLVATNLDLFPEHLTPSRDKISRIFRIPDQPRLIDLEALPIANESYDEKLNGLMVLDECATWLNSRSWNEKGRAEVIDWMVHARKRGWDVYFLIQHADALDAQAKKFFMEHLVTCKRTDRMAIPILGTLCKIMSVGVVNLRMPQGHVGTVEYTATGQKVDTWMMRGNDLYEAYDTKQIFSPNYINDTKKGGVSYAGIYQLLPPFYTKGRYELLRNKEFYMRLSNLYFRKLKSALTFSLGGVLVLLCMGAYEIVHHTSEAENRARNTIKKAPVVKIEKPEILENYEIVSDQSYTFTGLIRGKKTVQRTIKITNGNTIYRIEDLMRDGYSHTEYSNCYHVLMKENVKIVATCKNDYSTGEFQRPKQVKS